MDNAGNKHDDNEFEQGKQYFCTVGSDRKCQQTENTNWRVQHYHGSKLEHGFCKAVKELLDMVVFGTEGADSNTQKDGKENNLEHIAVSERFYRVCRNNTHENRKKRRRCNRYGVCCRLV